MKKRINIFKTHRIVSHETIKVLHRLTLFTIIILTVSAAICAANVKIACNVVLNGETVCTLPCGKLKEALENGVCTVAAKYGVSSDETEKLEEKFEIETVICGSGDISDTEYAVKKIAESCGKLEVSAYSLYMDGEYAASCGNMADAAGAASNARTVLKKVAAAIADGDDENVTEESKIEIVCEKICADRLKTRREAETALGCDKAERELELIKEYVGAAEVNVNSENEAEYESEKEVFSPPLKLESRGSEYIEVNEEAIAHGTEYVSTDELAVGVQRLRARGKDGRARTAYIVSGGERRKIECDVIEDAVDDVVYMGTYRRTSGSDKRGRFICPCPGTVTSAYGERELFGENELHGGLDIGAPDGTKICSADEGTVEFAGDIGNGYGIHVIVDHGDGFKTLYAHMRSVSVSAGDRVLQGEKLGEVGLTGKTTGYHLHFEVRIDGARADPLKYISVR